MNFTAKFICCFCSLLSVNSVIIIIIIILTSFWCVSQFAQFHCISRRCSKYKRCPRVFCLVAKSQKSLSDSLLTLSLPEARTWLNQENFCPVKPKGVTTQMKLLSMSISNSGERVLVKLILAFVKKDQKKILRRDSNHNLVLKARWSCRLRLKFNLYSIYMKGVR